MIRLEIPGTDKFQLSMEKGSLALLEDSYLTSMRVLLGK